ncbi:MAG TPA: tRNA epoxyqueuosine(34) reductase QueG, partial [Flavobacteriales bacterium]|nr:tRNA epoxyqueuosine(34) reductase QueG [Flavobacteriales bacterium]
MLNKSSITSLIKSKSLQHGFSYCGISKAGFLEEEAPRLEKWLKQNMHGKMQYMENYFDKRLDPTLLVPGAKSVISLLLNYYTEQKQTDKSAPKISTYAYGQDYHTVIKNKLHALIEELIPKTGDFTFRVFVDSAPVMDKAWAKKGGLGWVGKNSNLINKDSGSFFFIAEIICDLDLDYDTQIKDYCGTCTACIDACPTNAIVEPYVVDGSKCISYFTIELKDEIIPTEVKGKFENWMFGCDICQDVCPWNRFSKQHTEKSFLPNEKLLGMKHNEWKELT